MELATAIAINYFHRLVRRPSAMPPLLFSTLTAVKPTHYRLQAWH